MKKLISIILICLMLISVATMIAVASELDELIGLRVKVWQGIPTNWNTWRARENAFVEGWILQVRDNWLILKCGKRKYVWCYIPQIARIEILNKDYVPSKGDMR